MFHVLFGSPAFIALAGGVALERFSTLCESLPIIKYTSTIMAWISHVMLVIDAVLFLWCLVSTAIEQLKGSRDD